MPTYNFCVVVDDWDMQITHVIRGDDHVNNTPRQINIFRALGAPLPLFGHVPIILGDDGEKLSKRRGAVSVTAYEEAGYLPEAMLNYLARLGWSHGDDELFSARADGRSGSTAATSRSSPAQWDAAKLAWVNAHYLKQADDARLAALVRRAAGARAASQRRRRRAAARACAPCSRTAATRRVELADWLAMYFVPVDAERRGRRAARHRRRAAGAARRCATRWPTSPGTRPRSPRRSRKRWPRTA